MKVKDLKFKCGLSELDLNKRFYLFIECLDEFGGHTDNTNECDHLLIEMHERVEEKYADMIGTLSGYYTLDTPLSELTLKKARKACDYNF